MNRVTFLASQSQKSSNERRLQPLFALAITGDKAGYTRLLTAISELSKAYALRKLGKSTDCDDLVQEILISVHKALHTYDVARPCMPWLGAIMHYRLNDWLRSHYQAARFKPVPLEDVVDFLISPVTEEPFADEFYNQAVATLTDGQRAVIHAMYRDDLSVAETGEKLGLGISAVKVTAHRAYKTLRNWVDKSS